MSWNLGNADWEFIRKSPEVQEKEKRDKEAAKRQAEADRIRGDVVKDVEFGTGYGKELIGDKALGRLTGGEEEATAVREGRMNALKGFSAPELGAARERATSQIDRASEGALRRLKGAQASSGVRGMSATAQQSNILQEGVEQKRQLEQNLLIENRAAQQAALDRLQDNVQADLAAASQEKFAQLSTGLGFAQIGSAERAGLAANEAQLAAARSQGGGGGGGITVLCTAMKHHGFISEKIWQADMEAGRSFLRDPKLRDGFLMYSNVCAPLAQFAIRNKWAAYLLKPFIVPISHSFVDNNLKGRFLYKVLETGFCTLAKIFPKRRKLKTV